MTGRYQQKIVFRGSYNFFLPQKRLECSYQIRPFLWVSSLQSALTWEVRIHHYVIILALHHLKVFVVIQWVIRIWLIILMFISLFLAVALLFRM